MTAAMELDPTRLQRMIAHGETQLEALREGLLPDGEGAAIERRLAVLEDRVEQQDAVLKHLLRMLIEHFEDEAEAG